MLMEIRTSLLGLVAKVFKTPFRVILKKNIKSFYITQCSVGCFQIFKYIQNNFPNLENLNFVHDSDDARFYCQDEDDMPDFS